MWHAFSIISVPEFLVPEPEKGTADMRDNSTVIIGDIDPKDSEIHQDL